MIPKRIIQTAKSATLPLTGQASAASLRCLNPDFEYHFFDNQQVVEFLDLEFPQYRPVFDNFCHPIQRYDFFRYLAVFRLGGFYFDTDVYLARTLAPLVVSYCVFPFEELSLSSYLRTELGRDWELGNYAFGAEAGHPFLQAVIDNCVRAQREPAWAAQCMRGFPRCFRRQYEVLYSTGPGLVTRTFAEQVSLQPQVSVVFPDDVCCEGAWHCFGHFGIHLMQASWRQREGAIRRRFARMWENRRRRRLLAQSRTLGPTRPGPWVSVLSPFVSGL